MEIYDLPAEPKTTPGASIVHLPSDFGCPDVQNSFLKSHKRSFSEEQADYW